MRPASKAEQARSENSSHQMPEPLFSDTEHRLLDAAEVIFAKSGFGAATLAAIADRAKLNKTLIHYYFRSKKGLYQAMCRRIAGRHAVFLDDLGHANPVIALTTAVRRYIWMLAENRVYVRLCAYAALEGLEMSGDEDLNQQLVEAFYAAIRRGVEQELFRDEDPRHLLASVDGMCRYFFEHEDAFSEQWRDGYERDKIIEERCEHVSRMLLSGLGYSSSKEEV